MVEAKDKGRRDVTEKLVIFENVQIGAGGTGEVFAGEMNSEEFGTWIPVAIKKMRMKPQDTEAGDNQRKYLMGERDILIQLAAHEHIVRMYDSFELEGFYYMIFEYCAGGDLHGFMKK